MMEVSVNFYDIARSNIAEGGHFTVMNLRFRKKRIYWPAERLLASK